MWQPRYFFAGILLSAIVGITCSIPNLSKMDLSGCMKTCNTDARTCLDTADTKLATCAPNDGSCQFQVIHESEACLLTTLDCIDVCVKATEDVIKG